MINQPIPGQSLTAEPKGYPWENPPKYVKPFDAAMYHLEELNEPKKITAALDMLELDIDMVTLVSGILRVGVANGIHTVDVSLLIAPVIHEFIKGHADRAGIDYNEGFAEEDMDRTDLEYTIRQKKSEKLLKKIKEQDMPEAMSEGVDKDMPQDIPEEMPEAQPQGLMARQGSVM
tara:strand:+ start:301 stop:825 length:525 start_codon:yes stop_codon:yes gene_type:complete